MRTAFIQALQEIAATDGRVFLVCGDLGYSVLEPFEAKHPERYLNAGVAEQNMTGIAAGLALAGYAVCTYSIANFPVMRCLEQIRNDICYHNLNVTVVAVGGGLAYGAQGYTHHGVEDLAVMRVLPNMVVLAPGDPIEARLATHAAIAHDGPVYLRLGKAGEPVVHATPPEFVIGRAIPMRQGTDLTLISTGGTLAMTVAAAERLAGQGVSARVLSMPCIAPLDDAAVLAAGRETGLVATVEEHGAGGLASAVAEVLAIAGGPGRLLPIRLARTAVSTAGDQEYLRGAQGLSAEGIVRQVRVALR